MQAAKEYDPKSPLSPSHEFIVPIKRVKAPDDMILWENSVAYQEYMGFVLAINEAIQSKSLKYNLDSCSLVINNLVALLDKLDTLIDDTPPIDQPQRFGNQAFRTWIEKLKSQSFDLLRDALPEEYHRGLAEINEYFLESFGNNIRIDYGTGHEIAFVMVLCCLFKVGALLDSDKVHVATRVFNRYLILCRKLQQVYRMEPAGSHGVWSLDDYQFIPFIWGSAQLINHPKLEPCSFLQEAIVDNLSEEYMFLACIQYINQVKTGPFAEHSNQLWGISGVSTWRKINAGLIKMYKAEVLGKFPVVQHILFGSLLPLIPFTKNLKYTADKGLLGMTRAPMESAGDK